MQEQSPPEHRGFKRRAALGGAAAAAVAAGIGAGSAVARAQAQPPSACGEDPDVLPPTDAYDPDLGPNTLVFDESTPAAEIQSAVDAITDQMRTNQFGRERHAVLLRPGTYAVDIDLRFYTQVAGLGLLPGDTVVDGHVRVEADWLPQGSDRPDYLGNATQNFWRSVENLAIRNPAGQIARWAVSQAAPFRRIDLQTAEMQLWDGYEGWASGGFFADSRFSGRVVSGSQQQFFTRNSNLQGGWAGSVWNMVFVGTGGAPAHHFPDPSHTVVDRAPVIREKPFLYTASDGEFRVFKPAVRRDAAGTSWEGGAPAGTSISLAEFYVVNPGEDVATVNRALAEGRHLLFTPGVHEFDQTLNVTAPGTVVLGLGLATIIPTGGQTAIAVADVDGAVIAGLLIGRGGRVRRPRPDRPPGSPTTARTRLSGGRRGRLLSLERDADHAATTASWRNRCERLVASYKVDDSWPSALGAGWPTASSTSIRASCATGSSRPRATAASGSRPW
ncbi:hypothetical protein ACFQQE_00020 [Glycomyces mayteni]|uniref:hypothetical protein n=1 Tax=Glycomyces mayteni TaxID=543887 RepID=UPI00360A96B8